MLLSPSSPTGSSRAAVRRRVSTIWATIRSTSSPRSKRTAMRSRIGIDREELRHLMPAGGARNAIDCAMWDLEAKREGVEAHRLACVDKPQPLITTFTLGADEPEVMAEGARRYAGARAIKVKLTGELELDVDACRGDPRRAPRRLAWRRRQPGLHAGPARSAGRRTRAPIACHCSSSRCRAVARPTSMAIAARSRSRPTKAP